MARTFQVSFKINGAMDGSLQAALQAAANAMRGLGNAARQASAAAQASKSGLAGMAAGLNQLQQAAAKFRELKKALAETQSGLNSAQSSVNSLARKFREDTAAAEALRQKLAQLHAEQTKNANATATSRGTLNALRQQRAELKAMLKDLGVSGKKIPRELLGTDKGRRATELLTSLAANKAALEAQRSQFRALGEEAKKLAASIHETQNALKSQEQAARQSGRGFEDAKAKAASLKESLRQQQEALQRLRTSLGSQGFSTAGFAASERQLAAEIDRVNAALRQQQALTQARSQFNASATNLAVAGAGMMGAVYTAEQIAEPFKSATDKAIEFERVMSEVKALTQMDNLKAGKLDVVEKEMAALTTQAEELGATTIYKAQEVAEAQAYIARTGWQTNQILGATPIFLKLAASQHMDLARTADIATNVMTGFGHTLDSVGGDADKFAAMIQHDADVFAYTVTHSNQTFEQFGEAMKYAAPVAKNFGASIEEAAMMTKFMGDAGIQGSMAGTSMRQTMLRLVAPPKRATKAMQQYGITLDDANASWQNANAVAQEYGVTLDENLTPGRQFINVMRQIDKNMAGASDREKLGALSAITGINAVSGAMNIFGAGANQAENFTQLLEKCDGALEQTYGVMTDNTYGAMKSFESAWEAVQLSVGKALLSVTRAAAEAFAPLMTATAQFVRENPAIVQGAAAIAAALATIVVGAAAVKLAFAGWKFVTSSILLVQEALGALAGGQMMTGLIANVTRLRAALFGLGGAATFGGWSAMFASISTTAATAATSIRAFFASLTLGSMASGIAATLSSIGTAIAGAARAAMAFAFSPVGVALMALALAGLYCYQNWEKVAPVLSQIAGIVTGSLASAFQTVVPAVQNFINILGQLGDSSALQTLASVVGGTLVQAFTALLGIAATAISVVVRGLGDLVKIVADLGSGLVGAFNSFSEGNISEGLSRLGDTASKTFENIKQAGQHAFDGALNGAKLTGEALDVVSGKITVAQQNALRQAPSSAPQFDDPMMNAAQVAQPIDTSQTQAALDQVGSSAQNAATNLQGVDQAATGVQNLSTNASTAATNMQTAGTNAQNLGTSAQNATTGTDALGVAAQNATGGTDALGVAAGGAVGNISAMSDAAGAVAAALSSKAAEIGSITINVPTVAVSGTAPAANALGGIYKKGAFLTTFAEKSPEAAIPLDRSQRAIDLWTQTGQILGQLPGKGGVNYEQARKFEDAIKEYNKNPKDLGTLNKTLDTHAQVFGGSRGGQARYGGQSRRRAAMRQMPQTLPQPQGEMSEEVRTKVANLDRLIKAADYLPDTESNRRGKADLIRMREEYLRQQGYGGGRMSTVPQPQPSTARRSAYVARSRQSQVPMITAPPFNPDRPGYSRTGMPTNELLKYLPPQKSRLPDLPLMTPPFAPTNQRGALEGLSSGLGLGRQMSFGSSGSPTFTINVTVNGNANADDVKRGVEQAIPQLESFARQLDMFKHEAARRSFD